MCVCWSLLPRAGQDSCNLGRGRGDVTPGAHATKTDKGVQGVQALQFQIVHFSRKGGFGNTKNPKQTLNTERGVGTWQLEKMVFRQMASLQGWEATHGETDLCPASRRFLTWCCGTAWAWVVLCVCRTQKTFIKALNTSPGGSSLKI